MSAIDHTHRPEQKVFSQEQVKNARSLKFSKVLDHLGAFHVPDQEFVPPVKKPGVTQVRVNYKNRDFLFRFDSSSWTDNITGKTGRGAIDFMCYLTGQTFSKAVPLCLDAAGEPLSPTGLVRVTQMDLPYWPEDKRALPNEILRAALFNARNKTVPRQVWRAKAPAIIPIIGGGANATITYVGEELRQLDEKVWLQLIHLTKGQAQGEFIEFVAVDFIRAIGWPLNKNSYQQLKVCLSRMQASSIQITSERLGNGVALSMIPTFLWQDDRTGEKLKRWRVKIHQNLQKLFNGNHHTRIEWEQRIALPDGIASWLHGFYSSHREPIPYSIEDIARGAGLLSEDIKNIKKSIKQGLDRLVSIGFLTSYTVTKTHVRVQRA